MAPPIPAGHHSLPHSCRGRTTAPLAALHPAQGRTNGLRGRTNGIAAGVGRTNGLSRAEGYTNGLVNGLGFTNGLPVRRNTFGIVAASDYRRAGAFIALSIVAMFVLAYFLGVPPVPTSPFDVDGDFSEWSGVPKYADGVDPALPAHADLLEYAVVREADRTIVYGRTRGAMFPGNETSSVYVLIDNPATTGYRFGDSDVDLLAEVWGWNGTAREAVIREWGGGPDADNASSFRTVGSFPAVSVGAEFELALTDDDVGLGVTTGLEFTVATRFDDAFDAGAAVGFVPGALSVEQRPLTEVVGSSPATVIELRLRAHAASVEIRGITLDHTGGGTVVLPNPGTTLLAGEERTEGIQIDTSGIAPGALIRLRVRDVDAVVAGTEVRVPTTIRGPGARFYAQSIPAGPMVDGVFAEWTGPSPDADDPIPASVDLLESAFAARSDAFFYLRTEGEVLAGALLPERRKVPAPSGSNGTPGPPMPVLRKAAEDLLQVYVDSDDQDTAGYPVGGISADRLIEVRGRGGRAVAMSVREWNPVAWQWEARPEPVAIEFSGGRLEASVTGTAFAPWRNPRVVFAATDWSSRGDLTDLPVPTRGSLGLPPSPLHASDPDEVTPTPLDNTPTIDGDCETFSGEYSGGTGGGNAQINFTIGLRDDTQFLYVCIRVTADTSASKNDWGEVIFDTSHNGGTAPQTDDRLFWLNGNGDTTLSAWQGTGSGWTTSCSDCDSGNAGAGQYSTYEWYEFKIRYSDVWGTLSPSDGQVAGFAIIAYNFNAGSLYTWGGPAVDEDIPNTWGHVIYVPEFASPILALVPFAVLWIVRRRSRRSA